MKWMTWTRGLAVLALLATLGPADPLAAQKEDGGLSRPIALAPLGESGEVVVLESDGRLVVLSTRTGEIRTLVRSFAPARPVDMATYTSGDETSIFVTASRTAYKRDRTPELHSVIQISASGRRIGEWSVRRLGALSGVAGWSEGGAVFAATSRAAEILRLQPGPRSQPTVWAAVDGVYALGPLAVDAERSRLYAADPIQGALFVIDLGSKQVRQVGKGLGQLLSMVVDEAGDRLYMADASGRRIWTLDLGDPEAEPTVFAESSRFRQPAGVAMVGGTLWVADRFAGKLFALSQDGKIVRELD